MYLIRLLGYLCLILSLSFMPSCGNDDTDSSSDADSDDDSDTDVDTDSDSDTDTDSDTDSDSDTGVDTGEDTDPTPHSVKVVISDGGENSKEIVWQVRQASLISWDDDVEGVAQTNVEWGNVKWFRNYYDGEAIGKNRYRPIFLQFNESPG